MCTSSAHGPGSTVCMPDGEMEIGGQAEMQKCTRFSV